MNKHLTLRGRLVLIGCSLLALTACGTPPVATGVDDPQEEVNRERHAFNKGFDRHLLRPVSRGYGTVVPGPIRTGVSNVAENLEAPSDAVNGLLQGRPVNALQNTARFAVNSTIGIFGIFDVASHIGLPAKQTDFGETMYTWGVGEGVYVENPFFGPSTERDTWGMIVDTITNPLHFLIQSPESTYATAAKGGELVDDRYTYSATIDDLLYDSADSYSQARLAYLQNRRFTLQQNAGGGTGGGDDGFIDPYADASGDGAAAPAPADFIDPYEDTNAQ
ncbi:VacJ family lipoprotein [Falsirhodobacter algicola]|uniref:VacJ family lipoprotein n=1 Tax=Falsirhodobacter algicola TaxID=2692330 RepID=A0A8J8SL25_9RHOB|nr:VacJ family lipoprotein [Falsirhodobacter algicola]QUS35954.1 VacJ family lipoprotein [Falsirhodobacter algicola]